MLHTMLLLVMPAPGLSIVSPIHLDQTGNMEIGMNITRWKDASLSDNFKRIALISLLTVAVAASGAQFDAPYYELEKKHGETWAQENGAIDDKLASP